MISRIVKSIFAIIASNLLVVAMLIVARTFVQARYIASTAMQPTLMANDRIAIESVSRFKGTLVERGAIVCFYPPPIENDGKDLSPDLPCVLGRLTGLPFLPYEAAFIKRIIGLPGDRIRIEDGVGVYVNDKLLAEPYASELPQYNLAAMGDIGGRSSSGKVMHPYPDNTQPIVVPKGTIFVLGDDRNSSEDSHCWGFLNEDRIIGRAWLMYAPIWAYMHAPYWVRPTADQH
jgi:signal peptidase I